MSGKRSEKHGERGSENVGNDNWERAHVTPPLSGVVCALSSCVVARARV